MRRNQNLDQFVPAFAGLAQPVQPLAFLPTLQAQEFDPALVVTPAVGAFSSVPDFSNSAAQEPEPFYKKGWFFGLALVTLWVVVKAKT